MFKYIDIQVEDKVKVQGNNGWFVVKKRAITGVSLMFFLVEDGADEYQTGYWYPDYMIVEVM